MSRPKTLIICDLLRVRDVYCAATGTPVSSLSKVIFSRGGNFRALENGERDLGTVMLTRAAVWFLGHWPDGVAWPVEAEWLRQFAVREPLMAAVDSKVVTQ